MKIITLLLVVLFLASSCSSPQQFETKTSDQSLPVKRIPKVTLPEQNLTAFTGDIQRITVVATRYEFTPPVIRVNNGDKVILTLTSQDTAHGFYIPDYGINQVVNGGETMEFEFIADKKGEFVFGCSVFCGSGHNRMLGKLFVE